MYSRKISNKFKMLQGLVNNDFFFFWRFVAYLFLPFTWEIRSWQAASSFSFSSIFLLLSAWALSSCLLRFTRVFTSDFILLMYRRATVNSSSMRPPPSCYTDREKETKIKKEKELRLERRVSSWNHAKEIKQQWQSKRKVMVLCLVTLMSLLPTAMPISARSLSSDDIISVTLFFWWLVISFSFCSSESIDARTLCKNTAEISQIMPKHT